MVMYAVKSSQLAFPEVVREQVQVHLVRNKSAMSLLVSFLLTTLSSFGMTSPGGGVNASSSPPMSTLEVGGCSGSCGWDIRRTGSSVGVALES